MDFDDSLPVDKSYEKQTQNELDFVAITELCITMGNLFHHTVEEANTKEALRQQTEKLQAFVDTRSEEANKKKSALAQATTLRNARFEELTFPAQGDGAKNFSTKDIRDAVGILTDNNKSSIKQFFAKLHSYGFSADFHNDNYKAAFVACLEGKLLEEYLLLQDKDYTEIASYFYKVYHRPLNLNQYEKKLDEFVRLKGETLEIFMLRYLVLAAKADELLPASLQKYTRENHKLEILYKAARDPARTLWSTQSFRVREAGYHSRYESALGTLMELEKSHQCLPKYDFKINYENSHDTARLNVLAAIEANPAILKRNFRNSNKKQASPYSLEDIKNAKTLLSPGLKPFRLDPTRSSSQKPAFFRGKTNTNGNKPPFVSKVDKRKAVFIDDSRDGMQYSGQNRVFKKAKRVHFQDKRNYNNNGPPFPVQIGSNKPPFAKQFNPQSQPYKRNFSNPPGKPFQHQRNNSRPSYRPPSKRYGNNNDKNYLRGNLRHKSVNTRLYCERCGVDRNTNKSTGTDHTTMTCPHYKQWNAHNCTYCLKHKHIEAKHFAKYCLQAPPSYKD